MPGGGVPATGWRGGLLAGNRPTAATLLHCMCSETELSMAIDGEAGGGRVGWSCYLAVLEAEELHGLLGAVHGYDCRGNRRSCLESSRAAGGSNEIEIPPR
jgi:hypothetical protein